MREIFMSDFSYPAYRAMLKLIREKFELCLFAEAPTKLVKSAGTGRRLFLRHDVDLSLGHAYRMAVLDHEMSIRSTFMLMPFSRLYSLEEDRGVEILREMRGMGHELGLHLALEPGLEPESWESTHLQEQMRSHRFALEAYVKAEVRSFSLHRPARALLGGPLEIGGMVNAYSEELMALYISDSRGQWAGGSPTDRLLQSPERIAQLLVHPIWWGQESLAPRERLQAFYERSTRKTTEAFKQMIDFEMERAVGFKRSGR
jgi:hypothetical protein